MPLGRFLRSVTDGGCVGITQKPESIVGYRDAAVTDTLVSYSPVALYVMVDRSGSMITGFPEGSSQSWANATSALEGFVNDPASTWVDIGLGFFPTAPDNGWTCSDGTGTGSSCGTPFVEIGPVAKNGSTIVSAMNGNPPNALNMTPTECALTGMLSHCIDWTKQTSEQCAGVLITDGNPTQCTTDQPTLEKIAADGRTQGVPTFTLGLPGANLTFLDALASAGGTNTSIDVSGGPSAILAALDTIRSKVSTTTTTRVTTPGAVGTTLPCEWKVPSTMDDGGAFDPARVNVTFTQRGKTSMTFGYVGDAAACATASYGWHYDDAAAPTRIVLCDDSCTLVKNVTGEVDLALGCERTRAAPK